MFSYDADFIVDFDGDEVKEQKALLIRFTPQDCEVFVDRAFYSVGGKVATIDACFDVGGGVNVDDYQLFIEADEVCCRLSSLSHRVRTSTCRWLCCLKTPYFPHYGLALQCQAPCVLTPFRFE